MKKTFTSTLQKGRAWLVLFTVLFCAATSASGQLAMTRSLFTGTYTDIDTTVGATKVLWAVGGSSDEGYATALPIGFTFNYLGTPFTTFSAGTNGYISFNTLTASTVTNTALFTTAVPNNTLAPWFDDMTSPAVWYKLTGTAPNQVLTIQWFNTISFWTGVSRTINFQVKLYETTNVIEFMYGSASGTFNVSESASIGIENGTGGSGNYLDAVTGSAFVNNSFMNTNKWPVAHIRFTPGAPTTLPGGTYTVGLAGMFGNLSEAIATINHRGIAGPVTLSLLDALYDSTLAGGYNIYPMILGRVAGNSSTNTITIQPASGTSTLAYRGVTSGSAGNSASGTNISTSLEPIFCVAGADYVTMRNLNLVANGTNPLVDRGLYVINNSATDGSTNNLFENISVTLLRTNTSAIGIQQNVLTTPSSAAGANSNNIYRDLNISNVYAGMYLLGNATFPDLTCQIGTSSPTAFNAFGSATTYDIGNGSAATQTYGIRISSQSSAKVFNNYIRNVSSTTTTDGILCELAQGTTEIYNNRISGIRNNSTTSTSFVCGMRTNLATTGSHSLRVYNNMVSGISSAYTGATTATRIQKGIWVQSAGGGVATLTINVDGNSVYMDGSGSPTASSTAYEIGTTAGPVINTRNNSFTNFTGAQTAPALHLAFHSTSATLVGNTGSVSNYNDLYISNTTQGFTGQGNATTYATLANWQAAMTGQDVNSVSGDPGYISATDLHATGLVLNNVGNFGGSAWVTTDFDNQARSGATPDIGADEFAPATIDMKASALLAPTLPPACYSSTEPCSVTVTNNGLATIDFSVNPTTVTVNVTGAITATLTVTLNSGTLAVGASQNVYMGTVNMSAAGTYTFNGNTTVTGDGTPANDAFATVNITVAAGTISPVSSNRCAGDSTTFTLSGASGNTYQWEISTDGGSTWSPVAGATSTSYVASPPDTSLFRVLVCGSLTSAVCTMNVAFVGDPIVTNDTICGYGTATLTASGGTTYDWFTAPSGGTSVFTGPVYSPTVSSTTTWYVENSTGGGSAYVGAASNAIGTGTQSTAPQFMNFTVLSGCTIESMVSYPGAAGNIILEMRDATGTFVINSITVPVTAGMIGTPVTLPTNWIVTPGTYRLYRNTSSVSLYRNDAGAVYPYTVPGVLSITGNSFSAAYYYWGYNWLVSSGCVSNRVPVTAVVTPADTVTITPGAGTICENDSIQLIAVSSNPNYEYDWSPGLTLSDSTADSTWAMPSTGTTYDVVAFDSLTGCAFSTSVSIDVNPAPAGLASQSDTTICIGDSVLIVAMEPQAVWVDTTNTAILDLLTVNDTLNVSGLPAALPPGGVVSVCLNIAHTWDNDLDVFLISPTGTTFELFTDIGVGDDFFTGTCFTSTAVTPITAGVTPFTGDFIPEGAGGLGTFDGVNPNGPWVLQIFDDVASDVGNLLDWTITFNFAPTSLSWSSAPAGFSSTLDSNWVAPIVTTTYTATFTDTATGCQMGYDLLVNVNPPLTVDITPDPATVCPGDSIMLTASGSGGDGNFTYEWLPASVMGATYTITPSADETVIVRLTDGCTTPEVFDTLFVNYNDSLLVDITADTSICIGDSFTISSTIVAGTGTFSYAWSTGDTSSSITVSPTSTTTYSLTVTDNCGNISTASMTLTVNPLPVADFSWIDNGDSSATFTNMSIDATSYSWDFGDGTGTSTATNPTYTYTSDGTWIVTLIATNACGSDTTVDSITVLVGTPSALSGGKAVVYPNPNNGSFNLRVYDMRGAELDVEVFNLYGQRIWFSSFTASGKEAELPVALDAPKGVYILQVRSGGEAIRFQVTVQ